MDNKKLNKIDSNNNNQFQSDLKKSSLVIDKKLESTKKLTPISSTSTVSSEFLISSNDNVNKLYEQSNLIKKYPRSEKENHLMNSEDACVPQKINKSNVVKYGELVVLGYNGCINQESRTDDATKPAPSKRRKSKFVLQPKDKPENPS